MDVTFKGRHTSVPERFRRHAAAKLAKLERLDSRAVRIDVEVTSERNPRQAERSERVELTVRSRGPAIRAEAAAGDRYAALDLAYAKLEGRLRRVAERRKGRRSDLSVRSAEVLAAVAATPSALDGTVSGGSLAGGAGVPAETIVSLPARAGEAAGRPDGQSASGLVPIQMEGDGPLVVREKVHKSRPMTIDQALLEMELVGHDFYLFHDSQCGRFSVVYRRRGYDYGVIRLVEE